MTVALPSVSEDGAKPSVLLLHMAFGGQFEFLGKWLAANGWDVTLAYSADVVERFEDGIRVMGFHPRRTTIEKNNFRYPLDYAACNALGAAELFYRLRHQRGYIPDVVIAHVGWGVGLCVKQIWPETRYIAYHEWYYTDRDWRGGGRAERPSTLSSVIVDRMRNLPIIAEFDSADANWCPTDYQASRFPPSLRPLLQVVSDGVDCQTHRPDPDAHLDFDWLSLPPGTPVVTYATRGMEPLRGFPQFLRAVEVLQRRRDDLHAVVLADDKVCYGDKLPADTSWRLRMIDELALDHGRLHIFPMQARPEYQRLLQASWAHIYFSEPFVTSWSLSEAMATGCYVVGSDTPTVTELLEDFETGAVVDMDDANEVADAVEWALDHRTEARAIGAKARAFILEKHDSRVVFARKEEMMRVLIGNSQGGR
ncbi:glycosyltransferase [Pseudogemmobacter sonorensis]|uniref:glycosyltransferase n=1 Tax=Pseudogemmobacter sonorensis TaxID=2989681 RepID=UPI0036C5F7D7